MTNRREGREGREREGERDRERGSRAKPGIQLVYYKRGTSIFAPQRLPFYKALGVAAYTYLKVRASTVFMYVCSTFR